MDKIHTGTTCNSSYTVTQTFSYNRVSRVTIGGEEDWSTGTLIRNKKRYKPDTPVKVYANLAAYQTALSQNPPAYNRSCWMVRARLFKGLQTGSMSRQSIYNNEREKLKTKDVCSYCGAIGVPLTLDHLFAKAKNGSDSGDNFVYCCKSCLVHFLIVR